jgi:hypothetical protein
VKLIETSRFCALTTAFCTAVHVLAPAARSTFPLARGLPGEPGTLHLCPASLSSRYPLFKALDYSPPCPQQETGYPPQGQEHSRFRYWPCSSLSPSIHLNEVGFLA